MELYQTVYNFYYNNNNNLSICHQCFESAGFIAGRHMACKNFAPAIGEDFPRRSFEVKPHLWLMQKKLVS